MFPLNISGKIGYLYMEEWNVLFLTRYKNQQKWIKDLNFKTINYETTKRKHKRNASGHWNGHIFLFLDKTPKMSNRQIRLYQTKKLQAKETNQQTTYRMEETIFKLYIW